MAWLIGIGTPTLRANSSMYPFNDSSSVVVFPLNTSCVILVGPTLIDDEVVEGICRRFWDINGYSDIAPRRHATKIMLLKTCRFQHFNSFL